MRAILITGTILALLVVSYLFYRLTTTQDGTRVAVVRRGTIRASVETMGKVVAAREATLSLKTGGTVEKVLVEVGEEVEEGQLLLELDRSQLERRVKQAELNLEIKELQLARAKAPPEAWEIEAARYQVQRATVALQVAQARYDEVVQQEGASTSQEASALQAAKADYERAKGQFEALLAGPSPEELTLLEKEKELSEVALAQAREELAQTGLTAPFTGTVVDVRAREQENVHPLAPLMTIADLSTMQIMAEIDEIDVGEARPGQPVEIMLDAFPGQTLKGEIERIAPAATPQRGSIIYEAVVGFEDTELPLRLGMAANLTITTVEREGVLLLPNRAIRPAGTRKVVTLKEGGRVREVVTGLSNREETEIVSGLKEGDVVLIE
ncbi:MAG: efflux RND transporter periplasmic adaptor subunit [Anaerolineae bacterium]